MSRINPVSKAPARAETAHLNWMGGPSWDISNPVTRLRLAAASCFFGEPMYYHSDPKDTTPVRKTWAQKRSELSARDLEHLRSTLNAVDPQSWRTMTPTQLMESSIDEALAHDPEATLQVAVELRNRDYIRTTPQVIMVRAAHAANVRGTGLIRKYAPEILKRADEPSVQLAYQIAKYGKRPIPNSLKKAWRDAMTRFNEYGLAKYKMGSRAVKSVDVANLTHPASEAVNKLVRGELSLSDETWEAVISAGGKWEDVVPRMGHMALLRNLRNLSEKGVDTGLYLPRLIETRKGSMQLPFRYYSAHKALQGKGVAPQVLDAVEQCLMDSFEEAPHFSGRVASLTDNSGSAWGTTTSSMGTMHIAEIANLTGVITGMAADEGHVGVFGDRLEMVPVRKRASVFDQTAELAKIGHRIGGGTENGIWLFWDQAIRNREHWDHVFVYSDMQAGHGGLYGRNPSEYREYTWGSSGYGYHEYIDVPKLIATYRSKVNPKVNVYLVQVGGYKDTIVPEFYDRTYILGGWGEGILRFAAAMSANTQ